MNFLPWWRYSSPMKQILLPVFLLVSRMAFVQDDFESIYRNALNPYAGMTKEDSISFQNPFGKKYHSTEKHKLLEQKLDAFRTYVYSFDEESVLFERKLAAFELREYQLGDLTIRHYRLGQGNGIYTECYDSRQQLIALLQQDVAPYALLGLNENLPSQYLIGEGLVLFSYSGNELKQGVNYFLPTDRLYPDFSVFEAKELLVPLALFERRELEKMSSPFFSENEPHQGKLPENIPRDFSAHDCIHAHSCCASGCSCCPDFSYLKNSHWSHNESEDPGDQDANQKTIELDSQGRAVLTKNTGQGIILKALVLPHASPVYQFSDTKGNILAAYTSILSGESFIAAYHGESGFYEYDENDEAWVLAADGTFCKINKVGERLSPTFSSEQLEGMDSERISDSVYAVRLTVHEHLPYHIGNYVEEKFGTIVLFSSRGKLIRYTKYSSLEPVAKGLYLAGQEAFLFTRHIERQKKMYSLLDRNFHVLTSAPYELINPPGDGLMRVKTERGFGFIDMSGKEVIPCRYNGATIFENGRAYVILGDEEYFIDKTGKRVK